MLFGKPLTAGLVLLTLSAISHARAINNDLCLYGPDDGICDERPSHGYHSKRAPPRAPGRAGDDLGEGTGAQAGSQQDGGNQAGKKDGENAQSGNQEAGGAPAAAGPADAGQGTVNLPAPLPPYADLPANYQPRPNGVPGVDTLPNQIPSFNGLSTSADDALRRVAMQRHINWDIQASNTFNRPNYLLFVGDDASKASVQFKFEFNGNNREGVNVNGQGTLVDAEDVYRGQLRGDDAIPAPNGMDPIIWHGMLQSYGIAQRAAQNDRTVRILVGGKDGAYNRDLLLQEGSFFFNFELWVITSPPSRVPNIVVYRADAPNLPAVEIWKQGDAPMGKKPDFIAGTIPKNMRPSVDTPLIDLDFRKR